MAVQHDISVSGNTVTVVTTMTRNPGTYTRTVTASLSGGGQSQQSDSQYFPQDVGVQGVFTFGSSVASASAWNLLPGPNMSW